MECTVYLATTHGYISFSSDGRNHCFWTSQLLVWAFWILFEHLLDYICIGRLNFKFCIKPSPRDGAELMFLYLTQASRHQLQFHTCKDVLSCAFALWTQHLLDVCSLSQEDFFLELHAILAELPEVTELHPVPDAHVPVMKFKFNDFSIDLLYARLSLWVIPEVSPRSST